MTFDMRRQHALDWANTENRPEQMYRVCMNAIGWARQDYLNTLPRPVLTGSEHNKQRQFRRYLRRLEIANLA